MWSAANISNGNVVRYETPSNTDSLAEDRASDPAVWSMGSVCEQSANPDYGNYKFLSINL